ncbi:hypothetical protein [Paractinoplanes durhamensis]|uniref:Uncharacterized protein n=1 Tax=Paractinoplanes durhamensis TaxID=113563 RepID=A0ABQ3Z5E3_9ACTN|nr:hypothetical protein [Actinoplanes durhamensis]GIE05057.1 hypothetical protein Adu01nite_64070 [Actinoplanes durhamensis]
MSSGRVPAAASAAIALVMIAVYLGLIAHQDGEPAVWFVAGLAAAALLAAYGAARPARLALIAAGVLMLAFGLLGILSIGLPIIVAGVLALVAAGRLRVPGRSAA